MKGTRFTAQKIFIFKVRKINADYFDRKLNSQHTLNRLFWHKNRRLRDTRGSF